MNEFLSAGWPMDGALKAGNYGIGNGYQRFRLQRDTVFMRLLARNYIISGRVSTAITREINQVELRELQAQCEIQ